MKPEDIAVLRSENDDSEEIVGYVDKEPIPARKVPSTGILSRYNLAQKLFNLKLITLNQIDRVKRCRETMVWIETKNSKRGSYDIELLEKLDKDNKLEDLLKED